MTGGDTGQDEDGQDAQRMRLRPSRTAGANYSSDTAEKMLGDTAEKTLSDTADKTRSDTTRGTSSRTPGGAND